MVYHLIWCLRRHKPVLVGAMANRCRELIEQKCTEKGWQLLSLAIQPDHLHQFVRVWPTDSHAEVVKECKGLTAYALHRGFPVLKNLPPMWPRSYFASTAGAVSAETIQMCIDAQKGVR